MLIPYYLSRLSTETIEKAIVYLQQAFTNIMPSIENKRKSANDNKVTEAKNLLIQLQNNHLPCIKNFISLSFLMSKFQAGTFKPILVENKLTPT